MIKKITQKGICLMACALLVFMSALSVSALEKPVAELNSTIVNRSVISTNKTYVGSTVSIIAKSSVKDPDKCYYAFYSKYEDGSWMDIQTYSKRQRPPLLLRYRASTSYASRYIPRQG